MSRIGRMPVVLLDKVEATLDKNTVKIKWPLWELTYTFTDNVEVTKVENELIVKPKDDSAKALWGTTRSIINNMVVWVTEGYKKSIEIKWVWYKFEVQWNKLVLSIGYSHKVDMQMPADVKLAMDDKEKNILHISGIDKQLVWEIASKIRAKKKPEPYKGKGIRYVWEHVRIKAWKTWAK